MLHKTFCVQLISRLLINFSLISLISYVWNNQYQNEMISNMMGQLVKRLFDQY